MRYNACFSLNSHQFVSNSSIGIEGLSLSQSCLNAFRIFSKFLSSMLPNSPPKQRSPWVKRRKYRISLRASPTRIFEHPFICLQNNCQDCNINHVACQHEQKRDVARILRIRPPEPLFLKHLFKPVNNRFFPVFHRITADERYRDHAQPFFMNGNLIGIIDQSAFDMF